MIYVDASVVLAYLLAEDRRPADVLWDGTLTASRLLEYEIRTRLHARKLAESHGEAAQTIIGRIALLELSPVVLARALAGFPITVRTLDALHLASIDFLRRQVKNRYVKAPYPTWTDVGISALPPGAVAELVVTAWLGGTRQEAAE